MFSALPAVTQLRQMELVSCPGLCVSKGVLSAPLCPTSLLDAWAELVGHSPVPKTPVSRGSSRSPCLVWRMSEPKLMPPACTALAAHLILTVV